MPADQASAPSASPSSSAPVRPAEHKLGLPEVLDAMLADGLIAGEEVDKFRHERRYYKGATHPLTLLAEQRWKSAKPPHRLLDMDALTHWLADWSGLPYLHIDPLKVNFAAVTEVMSSVYATRFHILPVEVKPHEVVIATAEPFQRAWEKELQPIIRKDIKLVIANPEDIARFQVEFYNLARSIKGAMGNADGSSGVTNFEQLVELGNSNRQFDANDQHIVRIVDWLWQYAFDQRASDIHIEPRREFGVVRFRIDGVLHQVYQVPSSVLNAMTSRIKILGRMDVVEKRRPQDGRVKTRTPGGQEVELRLSTLPTAFGEKLVMRIFDPEVLLRDFNDLGFTGEDKARWDGMTARPNGIILVTGPTGSGKTTTLYSTLKELATDEVNVCTLEDPIEMVETAFNQVQVQVDIGVTFAAGVRSLMRQDPDIIMIGEIRDLDTADMAIQASLTGHLVLSTLHTNDSPSAVTRLLDLGVPPYLLNATLLGVMAQRLVRTLCPACKDSHPITPEELETWNAMVTPWKAKAPAMLYHPVGCLDCRMTGYQGRMGLYEILLMSPDMRKLLAAHADLAELRDLAAKEGTKPLRISGAMKIAAGQTTMEEVLKVAPPM